MPELMSIRSETTDDTQLLIGALDAVIDLLQSNPMFGVDYRTEGRLAHVRQLCDCWLREDEE